MRKLGLSLACLGLGVVVYLAAGDSPPPPAPKPKPAPNVSGRYVLTVGQGDSADQLTLRAATKPPGQVELELTELGVKSLTALSPEGRCEARFSIPADPEFETPAEVWLLQGQFVAGEDSLYLEGDVRVEVEGKRNAVFRRISSYYDGPLDE